MTEPSGQPGRRSFLRRGGKWLVVALAVVLALTVVAVAAFAIFVRSSDPADPGDFYAAPSPLPQGDPGTIIRTEELDEPPTGSRAWKVLYLSKSYTGEPTAVSGLLFVPATPAPEGGREVVASTHGTIGVASKCGGSNLGPSYYPAVEGLDEFLRAGYVVVAPDYEGLGTPGPHPYLVGESEAAAALDAVRAARLFEPADAGSRFAVYGASQGGQAALFTGQGASSYAPELDLVGVAAAAPATDLERLFEANEDTTFGRILSAFTIDSWSQVYPELDVDDLVTRVAQPVVRQLAERCIVINRGTTIAAALISELLRLSYLKAAPWEVDSWEQRIRQNSPGGERIGAPVYIAQGKTDLLVRPEITRSFVERLCRQGETVTYRTYPGEGHIHIGSAAAEAVAAWIADRFAGKPPPTSCD